MKTTTCTLIALAFLRPLDGFAQDPSASPPPTGKPESQSQREIQGYLDSLAADNKLSGAILVAKDGVPIASKAFGEANKAKNAPIRLDTKFNLGSMNKMFTGVAIAQLAQAGRLDFNDPISKHLPDYPNKAVAEKVTIHQLLTHTSGIASYSIEAFKTQREKLTTIEAYFPLFVNETPSFPPGEKFEYSNAGFLILGAIIEKVSGQDYYSYVRDHIYKPAGMANTGF
jgi:D-alanyl-D-alanine carboxypeptidase